MMEILSPAATMEGVIAAVRTGADAVYIGMEDFNARRNAKNFAKKEFKEAVNFCLGRGVKVFLTLNILISDSEMQRTIELAKFAADCGVEAFIVQDLGLAALLKRTFPKVKLHASTQMSVHSAAALDMLHDMGFSRVVVAREMDKKNLKEFCKRAKELSIEVETFVHGALCMSLSGQCYLSSMIGGRSGNRGLCAQPCRLPFLVTEGTGYDLSLKDLSLVEKINELEEIGVCSLKIEGRMKRPEYIAAATATIKSALTNDKSYEENKKLLKAIFSRSGFTDGYYENNIGRNMFGTRTKEDVALTTIVQNKIHDLYRRDLPSVALFAEFKLTADKTQLVLTDRENEVVITGSLAEKAKTKEITEEKIKKQLSKMGATCYYLENICVDVEANLWIPLSEINRMRREACRTLYLKRLQKQKTQYIPQPLISLKENQQKRIRHIARFRKATQIPQNASEMFGIIIPLEEFEGIKINIENVFVEPPRGILSNEKELEKKLFLAKAKGAKGAVCGNLSTVVLAKKAGLEVISDFGINTFNSQTLSVLKEVGVVAAIVSFEKSAQEISRLKSEIPKGIISYGRIPLMLTRNCPNKNGKGCKECAEISEIKDRKSNKFPIVCRNGFAEILNIIPLCVFENLLDFKGIEFDVLYFTIETKTECEKIIKNCINKKTITVKHTKGLYYRKTQ